MPSHPKSLPTASVKSRTAEPDEARTLAVGGGWYDTEKNRYVLDVAFALPDYRDAFGVV